MVFATFIYHKCLEENKLLSIAFIMQASITGASVRGLKGCKTLNKVPDPKNPLEGKEERFVSNSCRDMLLLPYNMEMKILIPASEREDLLNLQAWVFFISDCLFYVHRDVVTFPGFVDCIYLDAPSELHLDNGLGDVISIKNTK